MDSASDPRFDPNAGATGLADFRLIIVGGLLVFGSILAWRNVKLRRGDQHGAWRIAAFVFSLTMITWVAGASHVAGLWEAYNLMLVLAWALLSAAFIWVIYVALEPIIRRRLPTLLISWNRLLAGQFNDPMVGRDLLAGCAVALANQMVGTVNVVYNAWRRCPRPRRTPVLLRCFRRQRAFRAAFLNVNSAIFNGFAFVFLFVVFLLILREQWLAGAAFVLLFEGRILLQGSPIIDSVLNVVSLILLVVLGTRFGLLAVIVEYFVEVLVGRR